jgi:hypothetical protein
MRKGETAVAIPYLREYSQISSDLDDPENRCLASSALAAALDSLGMTEKALVELQLVSSISEQAGDAMVLVMSAMIYTVEYSGANGSPCIAPIASMSCSGEAGQQDWQV